MNPNAPKGPRPAPAQTVQQKAQNAAQSARQGAINEAQQFINTAASQVAGVDRAPQMPRVEGQTSGAAPSLPDHTQEKQIEDYKNRLAAAEASRMKQLKAIIEGEIRAAGQRREQAERAVAEQQAQQMQAQSQNDKKEGKGFVAALGKAAKGIKGRLGQVGKGKSEKGKAAKG